MLIFLWSSGDDFIKRSKQYILISKNPSERGVNHFLEISRYPYKKSEILYTWAKNPFENWEISYALILKRFTPRFGVLQFRAFEILMEVSIWIPKAFALLGNSNIAL